MKILVCGASGFIGGQVASALEARGHTVVHGVRDAAARAIDQPHRSLAEVDFTHDQEPAAWLARLHGIEVVVNAVGILAEHGAQTFDALHVRGPTALFRACAIEGVRRVVQISALGADEQAETGYHRSKQAADDCLLTLPVDSVVVQPSLVFGAQGASTRLFTSLAALPLIPLPGHGGQMIQPVHIDDLVSLVVRLVEQHQLASGERLAAVGGQALSLRAYLATLRRSLGLGPPRFLPVPAALVNRLAAWSSRWHVGLFNEDSWRMLQRGNTADAAAMITCLGRQPRCPGDFVANTQAPLLRDAARLAWLLPLLRLSLAVVWLVSGIVSLGLYPVQDSLAMLTRVGIPSALAPWMLYAASATDIVLGLATLAWPRRRLWLAQTALVLGYTAVITLRLPELWLHPFGPIVKNLPFLAALLMLCTFEEKR
ncbi:MAG: SDR family oxidoreductase [Rubrivivax sp.]|nr:MAG: SDR family oxidoreductase [Rubrivivax sp.]